MTPLPLPCRLLSVVALVAALLAAAPAHAASRPLQPLVDATPPGGTLVLEPGTYAGPVTIARPMTLDGAGAVTIDNGGQGTVVTVDGDGVTLQNLRIVNSGRRVDEQDSAILVRGRYAVVKDNVIEDSLFGINVVQADHAVIRRNRIGGIDAPVSERGDAIRLWYSMNGTVQDNVAVRTRDLSVWYSNNNRIVGNHASGSRYGLRLMHSRKNLIQGNVFDANTVGLFVLQCQELEVRQNRVTRSHGESGIGIGLKESDGITVADNELMANSTGLYVDISPSDPELPNTIEGNRIGYNGVAVRFHGEGEGNRIRRNDFVGNFSAVAVEGGAAALGHEWAGNHWDTYGGFDHDRDGVGDAPFEVYAYADRLWMDVPDTQFFRATPLLEMLDFMERLAPFSSPRLLMRDVSPALRPVVSRRPLS